MIYRHILFDLDGTLLQSEEGIINSIEYALAKMQKPCPPRAKLLAFVGPPLLHSFEHIAGLSAEDSKQATALYREYYTSQGLLECHLYTGIEDMLKQLSEHGFQLYLATAKPEVFAHRILKHFGVFSYFTQAAGIELGLAHHDKKDVLQRVSQENSLSAAQCVMVGDRRFDIEAARACQMDSIGVLYGYGSLQELQDAKATIIASNVQELCSLLCSQ